MYAFAYARARIESANEMAESGRWSHKSFAEADALFDFIAQAPIQFEYLCVLRTDLEVQLVAAKCEKLCFQVMHQPGRDALLAMTRLHS